MVVERMELGWTKQSPDQRDFVCHYQEDGLYPIGQFFKPSPTGVWHSICQDEGMAQDALQKHNTVVSFPV